MHRRETAREGRDEYRVETLWEPILLLPTQVASRSRRGASPELRLLAAVLEDALHRIVRNTGARRGPRWREFVEATEWLFDDQADWPFAFTNVCEALHLDVAAVRQRVRRMLQVQQASV